MKRTVFIDNSNIENFQSSNRTLEAKFTKPAQLKFYFEVASGGGTVSQSAIEIADVRDVDYESISVAAIANTNYEFSSWSFRTPGGASGYLDERECNFYQVGKGSIICFDNSQILETIPNGTVFTAAFKTESTTPTPANTLTVSSVTKHGHLARFLIVSSSVTTKSIEVAFVVSGAHHYYDDINLQDIPKEGIYNTTTTATLAAGKASWTVEIDTRAYGYSPSLKNITWAAQSNDDSYVVRPNSGSKTF